MSPRSTVAVGVLLSTISTLTAVAVLADDQPVLERYDHRRVDRVIGEDGEERAIVTPADWDRRRAAILTGMQAAMGPLPDRSTLPPLDVRVLETKSFDRFERRTLTYVADGNGRVHADLYVPKGLEPNERRPAMLALHPTGKEGKRIVAGEGPRANRQYATELADRGYVVLAPDYPSFGDDADYDFESDEYVSGTMKGIVNHVRGVDLLASLDSVDPERIGVIGHSLGGHNAMFVAAFEPRLKVIVSSCGWTPFHDYYGGKIAGWTSPRYMPLLKTRYELDPDRVPFDFAEVVAALAPRPFFSNSPVEDGNFDVAGVKKAIPEAAKIYELLGARDALQVRHPPCDHDFPTETRVDAYRFIDTALGHEPTSEVDFAAELPRIPPTSPEEAQRAITVAPGYRIELVAAEPLVVDPVAMCFDAAARLYVIEMRDYSEQDRAHLGRVRLLTDTDGDGRYDEAVVFADGLSWPTAITCWKGGVFVGAPPHLYYLKDTDGDDRADEKRIALTGFGRSNVQGMMNSLRWGPDCRIHGVTSSSGANLTSPLDPDFGPLELRGRDFSFDPRSFDPDSETDTKTVSIDVRPESGGGQHGMCFDDWGHKFVCSNSDHLQAILYEDRYAARHPYLKAPPARVSIAADGGQAPVFRRSPVEPWRIVRTRLRVAGTVRGPVEGGGKPAGYFTGATGVTIYRGDLMPELKGLAFIGDVGSNLVHRKRIDPVGTSWVGTRIDERSEFLASSDIWFRPVQMANGPDGALHILDMAREVIEHPKSLPPEIKQHLDLTSGRDRGRLWRVVPMDYEPRTRAMALSRMSTTTLISLLQYPNAWQRETAARLLVERGDWSRVADLVRDEHGRVHVLTVREQLGRLDPTKLIEYLKSRQSPGNLERTMQLTEFLSDEDRAGIDFSEYVGAREPRVRLQLAFTAGTLPLRSRIPLLADLVEGEPRRVLPDPTFEANRRLMRFAIFSSLERGGGRLIAELLGRLDYVASAPDPAVLGELAEVVGRQANADEVAAVLEAVAPLKGPLADEITRRLALGLTAAKSPLAKGLGDGNLRETLRGIVDAARTKAKGEGESPERLAAIRTLSLGGPDDVDLLLSLLDVREPEGVQLAALETLAGREEERIGPALVERWSTYTPSVRDEALTILFSRKAWEPFLREAVEQGDIAAGEVNVVLVAAITEGTPTGDAWRTLARRAVAKRAAVLAKYQRALELEGNATRGRAVFRKTCAACHRLEDHGHAIAPNLATIRNRGDEAILLNVLDPNREVNPAYLNYVVVTTDGRQHVGIISSQTATTLVLTRPEGRTETLLRADVETLESTGLSMMPEGLEKDLPVEAMADLLEYLRSVR